MPLWQEGGNKKYEKRKRKVKVLNGFGIKLHYPSYSIVYISVPNSGTIILTYCTDWNIIIVHTIRRGDILSPRTGRPKIENPKCERLEIRMTKAEAERLSTCAKQLDVSKTEVLMKGLALVENECQK